jgi:hypothetical protein
MDRLFALDVETAVLTVGHDNRAVTAELPGAGAVLTFVDGLYEWTLVAEFTDGAVILWDDYYDSQYDHSKTLMSCETSCPCLFFSSIRSAQSLRTAAPLLRRRRGARRRPAGLRSTGTARRA